VNPAAAFAPARRKKKRNPRMISNSAQRYHTTCVPRNNGFVVGELYESIFLDYFSALNNANEDKHDCHDQENVDKPPYGIHADNAKQPENKEYDCDSIKHNFLY
jgi:hypothetical protein